MGYFLDIQSIFNLINGYQRNLFMKSWKYLNISMKAGCGQAWPWRARLPSGSATWLAEKKRTKSLMNFLWKPIKTRIFNCHVWLPGGNYSQYRKQVEWWFHGNSGLNIAWESRHQHHPPLESLEPNHSSEIVRICQDHLNQPGKGSESAKREANSPWQQEVAEAPISKRSVAPSILAIQYTPPGNVEQRRQLLYATSITLWWTFT